MRAYERLLQYARVYTTSDPEFRHPSLCRSPRVRPRPHAGGGDEDHLGIEDARVDEHCYVYGTLPATPGCEKLARAGPHRPHGHRPGCQRRKRQPHPPREL